MPQGQVQKWMSHKGYGFIDYGAERAIFVHSSDIANGRQSLNIQENVTFEIAQDERSGKDRAVNVNGDGSGMPPPERDNFGGARGGRGGYNDGGYGGNRGGGQWQNQDSGNRDGGYGGGQGNFQQGVCRNFQRDGSCRFGDNCKFQH